MLIGVAWNSEVVVREDRADSHTEICLLEYLSDDGIRDGLVEHPWHAPTRLGMAATVEPGQQDLVFCIVSSA
ncbi:hypothetical protein [Leekyejoonella antrihumi]|uniref:Uncharacterized protein n=1 Tax=Leekyejoonella antrihumi TaxID=1660198 RepID=A0A563E1L9_9MICO|nr:hypothetical protein [Leekyejoonella antrihumi]TWP36101.1 hypothetical protein FGL98_11680 [Leekyejoonella antrihumi]